jgi:DNA-binding transcriptional LysR family regulator
MHRRHARKNVPTELLRALVTVVDAGSFSKAAEALDLTQSAISAQIARLGRLLGGAIFVRGQGVTPTRLGVLALQYARRMISVNDELLAVAGPCPAPRDLVIGLPAWLGHQGLIEIFHRCSATGDRVIFRCDRVERLVGELHVGSLDIAYLCNAPDPPRTVVAQWPEPMVWVKSPKLMLAPGARIPLISYPGTTAARVGVGLLQQCGMQFTVSFSAPDFSARLAAAVAGLGILAMPLRAVIPETEIIEEGLPPLPDHNAGIFARDGLDLRRVAPVLRALTELLAPPAAAGGSRPAAAVPTAATRRARTSVPDFAG